MKLGALLAVLVVIGGSAFAQEDAYVGFTHSSWDVRAGLDAQTDNSDEVYNKDAGNSQDQPKSFQYWTSSPWIPHCNQYPPDGVNFRQ